MRTKLKHFMCSYWKTANSEVVIVTALYHAIPFLVVMSVRVFSGFSGFLQPFTNVRVGGLAFLNGP